MSKITRIPPLKIFVSYAHEDRNEKAKLLTHLRRFLTGFAEIWHDELIGAGVQWRQEIWLKLHRADVVLFLISSDSIDSDFIWDHELQKTLERSEKGHVRLIPVYLKSCNWQVIKIIPQHQVIPRDNKPIVSKDWLSDDEPFTMVAKEIIAVVKEIWSERSRILKISNSKNSRFHRINELLRIHQKYFDMARVVLPVPLNSPEAYLYLSGQSDNLREILERVQRPEDLGYDWVSRTLDEIVFFEDICKQTEEVLKHAPDVWDDVRTAMTKSLKKSADVRENIVDYRNADLIDIDTYKDKYALPFCFCVEELGALLNDLAEEALSGQKSE